MNVTINEEGAKALVTLEGRLDTTNADQFMKDITPLMNGSHQEIEMDCTDMEYTSSQGLRVVLVPQQDVSARGAKLVLKNMKPHVKEVFDITGFSHIINIL